MQIFVKIAFLVQQWNYIWVILKVIIYTNSTVKVLLTLKPDLPCVRILIVVLFSWKSFSCDINMIPSIFIGGLMDRVSPCKWEEPESDYGRTNGSKWYFQVPV